MHIYEILSQIGDMYFCYKLYVFIDRGNFNIGRFSGLRSFSVGVKFSL